VFTDEMIRSLPIAELTRMRLEEGWDYADPVNEKDWRELMPDDPYAFKAPDHDPSNELKSNFIAGTRGAERDPDVAKVETDPKMQEIAKQTGASVKDLLLFREMMLDRYGPRYEDDDE
jgi:hypothetical protein